MTNLISLFVLLFFCYLCNRNLMKAYWVCYIFLLAFPLGPYTNSLEILDIIKIGSNSVHLYHVMPMALLFSIIYKNKTLKLMPKKYNCGFLLFVFSILIGMCISLCNNQPIIQDAQKFFFGIVWAINSYQIIRCCDTNLFIKNSIRAIGINVSLSIILYFIGIRIPGLVRSDLIGLYYNMYLSGLANAYILAILFCFMILFCPMFRGFPISKFESISVFILCIFYLLVLSDTRTVLLMCFAGMVGISIINLLYTSREKLIRWIFISGILSFFIIILIIILVKQNNVVIMRIANIFASDSILTNTNDTVLTRINTISYYLKKILDNPIGYGFGYVLPLINQYGRFHGIDSLYTDNAFIDVGMKCGLLGFFAFMMIVLGVMKRNHNTNTYLYKCMKIIYLVFCFTTMIMTTQAINNYQIIIVFWTFNILILKYNRKPFDEK